MFYSSERFFRDDRNHYDRYERDALCSSCGAVIGRQVRYNMKQNPFFDTNEKNNYVHCPYCGHKFNKSR